MVQGFRRSLRDVPAAAKPGPHEIVRLDRSFRLPVPPDHAYAVLTDAPQVAGVVPGATLTRWDGTTFDATVRLRLGLVPVVGHGAGRITLRDPRTRRVAVEVTTHRGRWVADVTAEVTGSGTASGAANGVGSGAGSGVGSSTASGAGSVVHVVADLRVPAVAGRIGRSLVTDIGNRMADRASAALAARLCGPAAVEVASEDDGPLLTRVPSAAAASVTTTVTTVATNAAGITVAALRYLRRRL